jgi:hypothetical protein
MHFKVIYVYKLCRDKRQKDSEKNIKIPKHL